MYLYHNKSTHFGKGAGTKKMEVPFLQEVIYEAFVEWSTQWSTRQWLGLPRVPFS